MKTDFVFSSFIPTPDSSDDSEQGKNGDNILKKCITIRNIQGNYAVRQIAKAANRDPQLVGGNKNRHRVSSYFAAQNVDGGLQKLMYKFMGHEEVTSFANYQTPEANGTESEKISICLVIQK